ncbi:uncharacterized protein [Narcine bancroftii]|uniref:uncharacterized protein isoform X2 n=1 Tax=Narcine bancroftii TaxID=1343680 RepID=UPI003831DD98
MLSNFKKVFLCILVVEMRQTLASAKGAKTDPGVDLFENGGAKMFKVVSFDTPTGVVLAITFASRVKSNYQIDWKAVRHEHKERILTTDIEQCKDKLWCNAPGSPYNYVEVILQSLDESRKFIKMVNIEPLKYRGYDPSAIKEKHGCDADPCMNNGKCVLRPESSLGYVCICSPGYSGELCQCAAKINNSRSSFLTSGCVVVLLLLIALGYLIYLHFFRESCRKRHYTGDKATKDHQSHSRLPPRGHKHEFSESRISRYKDTESPAQKDEQKSVSFQVKAVQHDFENPDFYNNDESPSEIDVNLKEKLALTDIRTSDPKCLTADEEKLPEDNLSHHRKQGPNEDMTQPISGNSCVQNGQVGIQDESPNNCLADRMPNSATNRNLPRSFQSDSIKSFILKEDDDFGNAETCSSSSNGWAMPGPMANEDLLDKKHYYLVSIDKLKSTTGIEFQKDDLPTQEDFIGEYSSDAASQALLQFNCDYETSSQSTDSCCSRTEESVYCALNNISLRDNCDTLVFIPRRPTDSNIPQMSPEQDDNSENSHVKEQKLVFPRHTKSGAVIYRLCNTEAESKD